MIDVEQRIIQWQLQNRKFQQLKEEQIILFPVFQWTGTAADLVELANGIIETRRINSGDVDLNNFVEQLSKFFSFEVKDCYDTFRAIRRRTDSRTLFLDEMIEKLNLRMDDMDNGIFKKKKIRKK